MKGESNFNDSLFKMVNPNYYHFIYTKSENKSLCLLHINQTLFYILSESSVYESRSYIFYIVITVPKKSIK